MISGFLYKHKLTWTHSHHAARVHIRRSKKTASSHHTSSPPSQSQRTLERPDYILDRLSLYSREHTPTQRPRITQCRHQPRVAITAATALEVARKNWNSSKTFGRSFRTTWKRFNAGKVPKQARTAEAFNSKTKNARFCTKSTTLA